MPPPVPPLPERLRHPLRESARWQVVILLARTSPPLAAALAFYVLASAVLPILVLVTVGHLVGDVPAAARTGLSSPAGSRLTTALVLAGAAYAAALVLGPVHGGLSTVVKWRLEYAMRSRLMAAVSRPVGIAHLEDPRVLEDLAVAEGALVDYSPGDAPMTLAAVMSNRLGGFLACAVLASYRWWLGAGMLAMWLFIRRPQRQVIAEQARAFNRNAEMMRRAWYLHSVACRAESAKENRVFGLGAFFAGRFHAQWTQAMQRWWTSLRQLDLRVGRLAVPVLAAYLASTLLLAVQAYNHRIALATLAVLLPMLAATTPVGDISWDDVDLAWMLEAQPRLVELERGLGAPTPSAPRTGRLSAVDRPVKEIRFEAVRFGYPRAGRPIFERLDLTIPAGRSTALVGLNGAGKTTLVKLLARLHDPDGGQIVVDGTPLTDLDPARWQRQVSVVFQDFVRYPFPARDNVGLGAVEHLDDATGIITSAERAGAVELVNRLPHGWDTVLSRAYPGGRDLSGGQWQRVALARALQAVRHGARVLVLDEPTAFLDVRAEADFFERFLEITEGLTTLLISHRFATVRRADRICVLEGGLVVEQGDHAELLEQDGRYARMFRVQAARFHEPDGSLE